jgi:hypothetical protein
MIPIVDKSGEGVTAVQNWLTEVGKMPEVRGFIGSASQAFAGFWKYLQDLWGFIQEQFGPVLK